MIDETILQTLIPLPGEEEELANIRAELIAENYPVTNLKNGGVFYSLIRVLVRIERELLRMARAMLVNLTVTHADDVNWLSLKAADYGIFRKEAVAAEGVLSLSRTTTDSTVKIRKGFIFKTGMDAAGEELRFLSSEEIVFAQGAESCKIPVIAETAGSAYNVPAGKITRCLIHLGGDIAITNADDWITKEGSDIEDIESLRSRLLGVWDRLAQNPTRDAYKSICEAVPGVLYISVDDQHPRGQGTVDIIVTSATGAASATLLDAVKAAVDTIAGPYDNLLVKSSETVTQAIGVTVVLPTSLSEEAVAERVEAALRKLVTINRNRILNELYLSELVVEAKKAVPTSRDIRVTAPADNVILGKDKVIVLGTVTVTIERV